MSFSSWGPPDVPNGLLLEMQWLPLSAVPPQCAVSLSNSIMWPIFSQNSDSSEDNTFLKKTSCSGIWLVYSVHGRGASKLRESRLVSFNLQALNKRATSKHLWETMYCLTNIGILSTIKVHVNVSPRWFTNRPLYVNSGLRHILVLANVCLHVELKTNLPLVNFYTVTKTRIFHHDFLRNYSTYD